MSWAFDHGGNRCVLCGKERAQVKKLILGMHGGVCLDCIDLCNDIIRTELKPAAQAAEQPAPFPSQRAEWLPARTVLLCAPRMETLFALLQTTAANSARSFSLASAREQHRVYRQTLEQAGVKIYDLSEALTNGCELEGAALARLRRLTQEIVTHRFEDGISVAEQETIRAEWVATLHTLTAWSLADLALLHPTITIAPNPDAFDSTGRYSARYELSPAANAFSLRDPMFTTAAGCVIGLLRPAARRPENDIVACALTQLGITPIYRVVAPGHLEGGDFMPCGDFVMQGQGLLSDEDGVQQCLDHRVYGYVEVAIVKDPRVRMEPIHLDAYFAVLDSNLCALCDDRIGAAEPTVDVYLPEGAPTDFAYRKVRTINLRAYLEEKGMRILRFSRAEQEAYAPNGLLLAGRRFLGVRGSGEGFGMQLQEAEVKVDWLDFDALTGGYGGPHSSSQVLWRS